LKIMVWVVVGIFVILVVVYLKLRRKMAIDKPLKNLAEALRQSDSGKIAEEYVPSDPFRLICERPLTDVEFEKNDIKKLIIIEDEADVNSAAIQDIFGKPLSRLFCFPADQIMEQHFCSEDRVGSDFLSCFFKNGEFMGFAYSFTPRQQPIEFPAGFRIAATRRMTRTLIKNKVGAFFEEHDLDARARNEHLFGSTQFSVGGITALIFRIDVFADRSDIVNYQAMAFTAEALNNKGKHQNAINLLLPDVEHPDNQNTSFFNELGIAYGKIGSKTNDRSYREKAYDYHKKAYDLDNNEPIYMLNLAMSATWIERYEEAKELMQKYLESGHARERKLAKDILKKLKAM